MEVRRVGRENIYKGDFLGYEALGRTFACLIDTIKEGKVVSIEAEFGRGKTFFANSWTQHLRQGRGTVFEVDFWRTE